MDAKRINPILNVSDIRASFAWFETLGWEKAWAWGNPPTFGGVRSGQCEVFLCEGCQGAGGVWMSIWVGNVDDVFRHCVEAGIDVARPPTDEPWHVREMAVRHPDGHVFRISQTRD